VVPFFPPSRIKKFQFFFKFFSLQMLAADDAQDPLHNRALSPVTMFGVIAFRGSPAAMPLPQHLQQRRPRQIHPHAIEVALNDIA
jgi:hypothetical protein